MRAVFGGCLIGLWVSALSSPLAWAAVPRAGKGTGAKATSGEATGAKPTGAKPTGGEAAAPAITPQAKARAAEAYRTGVDHFKAQRFEDAVAEFAKAYRLDPSPILVFNMARAFEELKRYPQAVTFYKQYLEVSPNAPDRAAVSQSITALEGLSAPRETPPPPASEGPGPWPWVVFGTGVALVGVGIGFGVLAGDRADTLDKIEANPSRYSLSDWNTARDEGQSYALGADIMLGVGLAAAAGGLAWWLLADDGATVGITPALGGVGLAGTF